MTFLAVTLLNQKVHRVCVGPAWCGQTPGPAPNEHLISSPVSRLTRPGPLSLSLSSLLAPNSLYSAGDGNVARSSHWPPSPQSRESPDREDQSHLVMIRQIRPALIGWNLETISWQLPGRPARPHHTITKIFYMLHHHRSSAYRSASRVGLAFNPWDCNNNPAQYWPVCPGVTCVQVFTWWGLDRLCWCQSVQSYLSH